MFYSLLNVRISILRLSKGARGKEWIWCSKHRCNTIEVVCGRLLVLCDFGCRRHDLIQHLHPEGSQMQPKGCHKQPKWRLNQTNPNKMNLLGNRRTVWKYRNRVPWGKCPFLMHFDLLLEPIRAQFQSEFYQKWIHNSSMNQCQKHIKRKHRNAPKQYDMDY